MKEVIYTIPINDAYDVGCGCPVCRLEKKLDLEAREYVMGAAMMEPDVRIMTNESGFCKRHFDEMLGMKNRLSLTLMLQSYLGDLLRDGVISDTKHISKKDFEKISDKLSRASDGCFICERTREKLDLYAKNIVYIWQSSEEFREKTRRQEYFCPNHLSLLTRWAKELLPKKEYSSFCTDHFAATRKILESLEDEVTRFCNSFNYKFRDVPLNEAEYAAEHTIKFLFGDMYDEENDV